MVPDSWIAKRPEWPKYSQCKITNTGENKEQIYLNPFGVFIIYYSQRGISLFIYH